MKKKLLIVGGGYADIPLINAGKRLGFEVTTTGNRPQELGHRYSDRYIPADFSDPQAILELARKLNIDAICACSNDFSALSSAYVAEAMGLKGHDAYETSQLLHHKDRYRQFAITHHIPSPYAKGFDQLATAQHEIQQFQLPIMVKPVDLTGGKGITKIETLDQANKALEYAFAISRVKKVVLEEFIEGSRHGFSAFIREGKVVFYFMDDEYYHLNPYMVAATSTPATVNRSAERILCENTEKIAKLLALTDGIFHVQFIMQHEKPIIIEICRRSPGDLYTRFVEIATRVPYPAWIVQASSGAEINPLHFAAVRGFYGRYCIMAKQPGTLRKVTIDHSIKPFIVSQYQWWHPGDEIKDILVTKLGIVFLKFTSKKEMLAVMADLPRLIQVVVA